MNKADRDGGGGKGGVLKSIEIYGFVGWVLTSVAYVLFLIWAYVPEDLLHALGVTYYPDKAWALAIPAFLCTTMALSGIAYVGLNMLSTASLHSMQTLTDSWAREPLVAPSSVTADSSNPSRPCSELYTGPSVPYFADLNIGVVNHLLYYQPPRKRRPSRRGGGSSASAGARSRETSNSAITSNPNTITTLVPSSTSSLPPR